MALELTLLPLLVTLSLSLVQMLLCLILRPALSYVVSIVVMIASAYCPSPLLLGNYAMACAAARSWNTGAPWGPACCSPPPSWSWSAALGAALFRKTDILQKED